MLTGLKLTTTDQINRLTADLEEDVRAESDQARERLTERLHSARATAAYRIRNLVNGLSLRWPSTFEPAQFEAQFLPLFDQLTTAFNDAEVQELDWTRLAESLERQASDLAARIVREHEELTPAAVELLRKYLRFKAEAPCYAAAVPALRATIARLRQEWAGVHPTAAKNCTTYLTYRMAKLQPVLTEAAERAAEAVSSRDQRVAAIEAMPREFEARYGVKVPGVKVDQTSWKILPMKGR